MIYAYAGKLTLRYMFDGENDRGAFLFLFVNKGKNDGKINAHQMGYIFPI